MGARASSCLAGGFAFPAFTSSARPLANALATVAVVATGAPLVACHSTVDDVNVALIGPIGAGPFDVPAGSKAVATVALRSRSLAGSETPVASTNIADGALYFPPASEVGIGAVVVAGVDASGATRTYGRSPPLDLSVLPALRVALTVFLQPVDSLRAAVARPGAIAGATPMVQLLSVEYALIASSGSSQLELLDLVTWQLKTQPSVFGDGTPVFLATAGTSIFSIDKDGGASVVNAAQSSIVRATPPAGFAFTELIGGAAFSMDDGTALLVGTKATGATATPLLHLALDGSLTGARAISGAVRGMMIWLPKRGLVVLPGGGQNAYVLDANGATTKLALTTNNPAGAAVAARADGGLVEVDLDGHVSSLDPGCSTSCTPTPASVALAPIVAGANNLVIEVEGGELAIARGESLFVVDRTLRTSRRIDGVVGPGAVLTALPTGQLLIVDQGGTALSTYAPRRE